ncbi:MAG: right-handed parallel beta-helix repeat-containing protein, partial [Bacteroidia bacterium]|nr:right-handed parallel beta-helix repeat-containing protein [Bacteroidia bacterium]
MSHFSARLFPILVVCCFLPLASFAQTNLQELLDQTNDGDTLYIEKNDYISDNSITLTGRKQLTLIFEKGATVTCSSHFQDIIVIQNCIDIHLYNGTFQHLLSEETNNFGSGFYLSQSKNIRIHNSDIENNGIRGVIAQSVNGLEMVHCQIRNNAASAFLFQEGNTNIVLKSNEYENNGKEGDEIYDFKKNEVVTDSFESIDERTLTSEETVRMDSLFNHQMQVFPRIRKAINYPTILFSQYDSLEKPLLNPQYIESLLFPIRLDHSQEDGKNVIWLSVPENVNRYLCASSGLARFDTRDANAFFKYDEPDFTNISPKAF